MVADPIYPDEVEEKVRFQVSQLKVLSKNHD